MFFLMYFLITRLFSSMAFLLEVKVYNMYALELGKTGFLRTLGMLCTLH